MKRPAPSSKALVDLFERCQTQVKRAGAQKTCTAPSSQSAARKAEAPKPRASDETPPSQKPASAQIRQASEANQPLFHSPPPEVMQKGGWFDNDFPVSVLNEKEALALFKRVNQVPLLDRYQSLDDCAERAKIISEEASKAHKVKTGFVDMQKGAWIAPYLGKFDVKFPGEQKREEISWTAHVAPFVHVKKNGKTEIWVLDSTLEPKRPLTLDEWKDRLSSNPSRNRLRFREPTPLPESLR